MPQKTLILAVGRLQGNSEKYGVIFETLTFGILKHYHCNYRLKYLQRSWVGSGDSHPFEIKCKVVKIPNSS